MVTEHEPETWRSIPSTGGLYEASDAGRIRSFHRSPRGRVLKPTFNTRTGYLFLDVVVGGVKRQRRVHQLVCEAFHGQRPDGLVTRHLDGDKLNNDPANLRYGTYTENALDKVAHGQCHQTNKTECIHGHAYTPENTGVQLRKGRRAGRYCRKCRSVYAAEWAKRRKVTA